MLLRQIFDPKLAQYAYLIGCQQTGEALILDPERDVDRYVELAEENDLRITAAAETHIHADFLSGARELAERYGVRLYLSEEGGDDWQYEWAKTGDYDVHFLHHDDTFSIGNIELRAVHTPGHTPEHLSFLVTDRGGGASEPMGIATGDFVFVGDLGRPDLLESAAGMAGQMKPSARRLYHSLDRFVSLPEFLQVWPAHGAGSACGKALGAVPASTVGYETRHNAAIDASRRGEDAFVDSILEGQPEPPVYFADMKRLNKEGPPLLGDLPEPRRLEPAEIADLVAETGDSGIVVLDTRKDRRAFLQRHLEGSLWAPLESHFSPVVGSYVQLDDEIVLLVEEESVEEVVRDLVRIGFDRVRGFVEPSVLDDPALVNHLERIPTLDFKELEAARKDQDTVVLDVRRGEEYNSGHVPDALHVPHVRLLPRLDETPKDRELLVHCRTGVRATAAAALLARAGRRVRVVDDEFSNWSERSETAA